MSGGNFDGTSFDSSIGGFDVDSTADTHDGFDASELNKKLDGQRAERDEARKSHREHLRDLLEAAFAPEAPEPVAAEVREAAAPVVERMESGAVRIDWDALAEQRQLEERIYAFREAFWREQQDIEDEEEAVILLALH